MHFDDTGMSDTLTTLKELAAQVRGATRTGENTAERVGRLFVGILALMEIEISFRPSEGYDTLGTLKELAAQVRSATEDSENTAERVGRVLPASWICWSSPVSSSILPKEMIP